MVLLGRTASLMISNNFSPILQVSVADYMTEPGFLRVLASMEEGKAQKMEVMAAIACIKVGLGPQGVLATLGNLGMTS